MVGRSNESAIKPVDVWILSPGKQSRSLYCEAYVEYNNQDACISPKRKDLDELERERDVQADTETLLIERALEANFRAQQLSNFHDRVCQRVTAQARQRQLEAAQSAELLSNKCSRLLQPVQQVLTECSISRRGSQHDKLRSTRLSGHAAASAMLKEKAAVMDKNSILFGEIERMLRQVGQTRDFLLQSAKRQHSLGELKHHGNMQTTRHRSSNHQAVDVVPPQQRAAVLAAVRREYMAAERAKAKGDCKHSEKRKSTAAGNVPTKTNPRRNASPLASEAEAIPKPWHVRSIDISSGGEVRVHRHVPMTSTPWRSKQTASRTHPTPTPLRKEQNRFLDALQIQLGAPALCSCPTRAKSALGSDSRKGMGSISSQAVGCANNCALYKQPKKREKLLAAVCDQR